MNNGSLRNFKKEAWVERNIPKLEGCSAGRADQTKDVRKGSSRRSVQLYQQQLVHSNSTNTNIEPFFLRWQTWHELPHHDKAQNAADFNAITPICT